MIQSIEQGRQEDGNRSIADKIIKRIHDLEKTVENNFGRWAWELLQNAKDSVADETRKVNVILNFNNNEVSFMHNGNHFTEHDIRGLINQISSKEVEEREKSNRVGRFGTGFITTHLLSKVVHVKGIVQTENNEFHKFKFPLDREGTTTAILAPKIETTWLHFHQSTEQISSIDPNQFNTIFTYPIINEKQKNIAKRGIDEFSRLIPYVLAFIPKIGIVTINNGNEVTKLRRQPNLLNNFIVQIEQTKNSIPKILQIALCTDSISSVAIEIETNENSIKELINIPRLFCDFPLIGTEEFNFPVILNSFYFNPQTERDGIWLRGKEDKEVSANQYILENAIKLYEQLMQKLAALGIGKLYHAVNTKLPDANEKYFDKEWYVEKIQKPLREKIEILPIVDTIREGRRSIKKENCNLIYFPSGNEKIRKAIWDLGKELKFLSIPNELSFQGWNKVIWRYGLNFSIFSLFLQNYIKQINDFNTYYEGSDSPFTWLNKFYILLIENNEKEQFTSWALVPSQSGEFHKTIRKEKHQEYPILFNNKIQDEILIHVLKLLGEDWNKKLIHNEIITNITPNSLNKNDIARQITKQLNNINEDWSLNQKNSVILLTEWFENNEDEGKELFPELYRKRAELFMRTIPDKENLYYLMKSKTPLSTLSEIAKAIENDPEILNIIEKRKQDLTEEKERNEIGEVVENLLAEILINYGFTVNKTHIGKDLIITCKGRINYDIEVKSTSTGGFVSLTSTQANTAIQKPKNYSLCVVHKNGQKLTKEYITKNVKFVTNIGELIVGKVQDVQRFNNSQSTLTLENEGIGILIENPLLLKYKVSPNIWALGTTLPNFIEKIKIMNTLII